MVTIFCGIVIASLPSLCGCFSCKGYKGAFERTYSKTNHLSPEIEAYEKSKTSWTCEGSPCCVSGKICDPRLGCFYQGADTPWCHQGALPQSPEQIEPQFIVFGPGGKEWVIDFALLEISILELTLNTNLELWFIIHGFGQDWPRGWMYPMKDALVAKGHNVIICRWTKGSAMPDYFQATANTRMMGAIVGKVANTMRLYGKLKPELTTILGFSLGAHVAGYAGSYVPGLKKVIGIDPAGPLYGGCDPTTRLNHTAAQFVMAIHCNGEPLIDGGCGSMEPMAHVDFYANGGQIQAGCKPGIPQAVNDILHMNFSQIFGDVSCSHIRCPWVFITSILNAGKGGCNYKGYPCSGTDDWLTGNCFTCPEPLGCPVPGYETTNGSPFKGTYHFGTLAQNNTDALYCGRTYKMNLTSGSQCGILKTGCSITSQLIGPTFSGLTETLINGAISQESIETHISMFHWSELPTQIRVCYSSQFLFIPTFDVKILKVMRDDGLILQTAKNQRVLRNQCSVMRLINYGANQANI